MKVINTIIVAILFIIQNSYGFTYHNTLFSNNRWVPENKDEEIGYEEHIKQVNDETLRLKEKNNTPCKRKMKYFTNNDNINFNQDGEISMLE